MRTEAEILESLGGCEFRLNPCESHTYRLHCPKCRGECELAERCGRCRAASIIYGLERGLSRT